MSERYSKLFSLPENLYTTGAPVVIAAGALLKDNQSGNVLAQLKLQNINSQTIKAATVQIFPMDTAGDAIDETATYQYLDLNAGRDEFFGQKTAIPLPNAATRSFSVIVTEIIFSNNEKWIAEEAKWRPLKKPTSMDWGDPELVKQFHREYGEYSNNMLLEDDDLWICVCGAINRSGETCCHRCGQTLDHLRDFNIDDLRKRKDERLALEAAAAEKKRLEEEEAKRRNIRTAKRVAAILAVVTVLCVAARFVIGVVNKNRAYSDAVALMEQGEYEQAIAGFQSLGDYKDSTEQIKEAEHALALEAEAAERASTYNEALLFLSENKYEEACSAFDALGDYKDSQERLKESRYHQGLEYLEQGNHMAAYDSFCAAGDYGDAKKQLEQFQKMPVKVEYSYGDGKGYVAYYEYTANGKILTYWSDEAKQRTEYFYNDDSVLIQVKQWNYLYLVSGEPTYYLIDFDTNGIPVKYENTADDIIVEYDHVFAEDGSIKSITCTQSQYSGSNTTRFNIVSATFDFSSEDETYFVDKQSMGAYLNAFSSDRVYKRYWISVGLYAVDIDIYEVGSYELDEHGNIIKASVRDGIFNEDGGLVNEYTVENTYDNDSNLIKVVEQDNKTHDTITYEYTYEYIYCPDVA